MEINTGKHQTADRCSVPDINELPTEATFKASYRFACNDKAVLKDRQLNYTTARLGQS